MTKRQRWIGVLAPLGVVALVVLGAWMWLGVYTRHDAQAVVPGLKGLTIDEAKAKLGERGLGVEVIDSVYNDDVPKGTVVDQDPKPERTVKPGRRVYVVMNASQPKMLNMPALVNLSKRQAISVLEILGLRVKELQYRPDPCVDCVVEQLYNGRPIAAEARIRRGEAVTLVLGSGQNGTRVQVPDVRGLTFAELKEVLNMSSLNLGVVVEVEGCGNTGCDTALARVARQSPEPYANNMIGLGGMIDIWLTMDTTTVRPAVKEKDPFDNTGNDHEE